MSTQLMIFPHRVSHDFHPLVLVLYRARGQSPVIRQEAIQMQTIISLVSAGLGMALVPASMRHLARTGVRYLDLAGTPPLLETGLAWRRDDPAPTLSAIVKIAETVGDMWRDQMDASCDGFRLSARDQENGAGLRPAPVGDP